MVKKNYFDDLSIRQIQKAQQKLDKLCLENDVNSFCIKSNKGRWKELVLSMSGISLEKPKKKGRKGYTVEEIEDIGTTIEILHEFENFDKNGNSIKTTKKDTLNKVADMKGIKSKRYESGRESHSLERVRGIHDRYKKSAFQEKLKNKIEKERDSWDEKDLF